MIAFWLKDDPSDVQYVNVSTNSPVGTSYKHMLEGLRIWAEYFVQVAAFTVSQGPFSDPYLARTDEGGNVQNFQGLSQFLKTVYGI